MLASRTTRSTPRAARQPPAKPAPAPHALSAPPGPPLCPYCGGRDVIKSGKRYNLAGAVQLFRCSGCSRKFSSRPASHTTYPLHAIIETLSLYDRGYTLEESARRAGKRHRLTITKQLAASWKDRYADRFPYFRIRDAVAAAPAPRAGL